MRPLNKIKTRYYSKEVLKYLLIVGVLVVTGASSFRGIPSMRKSIDSNKKTRKKAVDSFHYLKKRGLIEMKKEGHDIRIALTKEGRELAGKYQIDDLSIPRPKKWDKKWRVIIFDIPSTSNMIRDIFRRKLKEFGFHQLQKSTWVYPFACKGEIRFLREFLGADTKQIRVLEVSEIEDDGYLRKIFHL